MTVSNSKDTNQASEDELRQELRETLLDKLAIIKYGEAYKWLFDVDKLKVDSWTKDLQALISDRERLARIDELRYLLEDFGIEDDTQPIQKRISELTKLEAEL